MSQRLVKTVDNKRTAAIEILVRNARIEALIEEGRDSEILDAIAEGKEIYGSQTFDQALFELYKNGIISEEEALSNASVKADLTMKFKNHNEKTNGSHIIEDSVIDLKM